MYANMSVMETGRAETGSRNSTERTAPICEHGHQMGMGGMKDSRKAGQNVYEKAEVDTSHC